MNQVSDLQDLLVIAVGLRCLPFSKENAVGYNFIEILQGRCVFCNTILCADACKNNLAGLFAAVIFKNFLFQFGFLFFDWLNRFLFNQFHNMPSVRGKNWFGIVADVRKLVNRLDKFGYHSVNAESRKNTTFGRRSLVIGVVFHHILKGCTCNEFLVHGIDPLVNPCGISAGCIFRHRQEDVRYSHLAK